MVYFRGFEISGRRLFQLCREPLMLGVKVFGKEKKTRESIRRRREPLILEDVVFWRRKNPTPVLDAGGNISFLGTLFFGDAYKPRESIQRGREPLIFADVVSWIL